MIISKMLFKKSAVFKEVFADEYALHQAVWDLFGDRSDRQRDFLYRLEALGRLPIVYAVSSRFPNDLKGLWGIESKEYSPKVINGMVLDFTVRINPTVKRNGKRHDVVMDAKYQTRLSDSPGEMVVQEVIYDLCAKWIEKRAQENGFKVIRFRPDAYRQNRFKKEKGGVWVRYSTVDITGVLEVIDEKLFGQVLFNGLGPEKGFGCGLMMVRRK